MNSYRLAPMSRDILIVTLVLLALPVHLVLLALLVLLAPPVRKVLPELQTLFILPGSQLVHLPD